MVIDSAHLIISKIIILDEIYFDLFILMSQLIKNLKSGCLKMKITTNSAHTEINKKDFICGIR